MPLPARRRLVLFAVFAALVALVLWQARASLWPFVLGLALAYLLAPVVDRLHRAMPIQVHRHPLGRPAAIIVVYAAFIALLSLAASLVLPPLGRQAAELARQTPAIVGSLQRGLSAWIDSNAALIPPPVVDQLETVTGGDVLARAAGPVVDFLQMTVRSSLGAIGNIVTWLVGLVLVPIWLVYILKDTARVREGVLAMVPHDIRPDFEALRIICDRVLAGYVRGQLLIALILGILFTLALLALRVPYALLLGAIGGILAVIPFVGSILGALIAVAVAFGTSARLAALVALAFLGIQQIDNLFISPRVQGRSVSLNPAVIMVVLVVGQSALGPIGLLVAVPLTAILRDVAYYLYLRVGEDRPTAADALTIVGYGPHVTSVVHGEHPTA